MAVRKRESERISRARPVPVGRKVHGLQYGFAAAVTAPSAVLFASSYAIHPYGPWLYAITLLALALGSFAFERAHPRPAMRIPAFLAPGVWFALLALLIGLIIMRGIHQHLGTPMAPAMAPLALYVGFVVLPPEWYREPDGVSAMLEIVSMLLGMLG